MALYLLTFFWLFISIVFCKSCGLWSFAIFFFLKWTLTQLEKHWSYCSVPQSCPTLCSPVDCSMTGFASRSFTVFWRLLRPMPIESMMPSTVSPSVTPFSSCIQSFPASGSFPMSCLVSSGGQSIGASALTSIFPVNIQDWFPLGWTGWISLQSKGLSRLPSSTVQKHHVFRLFVWRRQDKI